MIRGRNFDGRSLGQVSPDNNFWVFNNMCGLRREMTGVGASMNGHPEYLREFLILSDYALGLR
jgi:hypothetical protein